MSENIDTDSMLDVFTGVEVEENSISLLSRSLGDVSIQSLLEQTKQVAGEIKQRC
jgi:ribosomal protein L12E/L44/L45/RPP1/RPP2